MATMFRTPTIKIEQVEGLQNDVFFDCAAYDRTTESNINQSTQGPRAKRVSLSSAGPGNTFMPTPPDSPVFVELTTAVQDTKVHLSKQIKGFQEGTQAVPNLEMNSSFSDLYSMNTVYSPFQTTSPFYEGISDDGPLGPSDNVLVKQELQDSFPDVLYSNNPLDLAPQFMEQSYGNLHQFIGEPIFEAPAPPEYSHSIPSPTSTSSFDSLDGTTGNCYQPESLPDFTSFTTTLGREQLNSGGEEDNFDSGSEASFTLNAGDSDDDNLDDILPFDPNDPANNFLFQQAFNPHTIRPRTHAYRINTVCQNVSTLSRKQRDIPTVASQQNPIHHKKPRGRPKKHIPNFGDGPFGQPARRGRGRRDAMKGNHLWEFIRDLLKNAAFCPKIIRWEEKDEGVFRFVNSEAVASMWGKKKNNPAMTYEKLSRAMRYYYKRDILERVDGRRLVYKFGKKAFGWEQAAGLKTDNVDSTMDSTVAPATADSVVDQEQK